MKLDEAIALQQEEQKSCTISSTLLEDVATVEYKTAHDFLVNVMGFSQQRAYMKCKSPATCQAIYACLKFGGNVYATRYVQLSSKTK